MKLPSWNSHNRSAMALRSWLYIVDDIWPKFTSLENKMLRSSECREVVLSSATCRRRATVVVFGTAACFGASWLSAVLSGKGKGKDLDTWYSAAYMSRDQQRFTISEVAADWHKPTGRRALCGHPLPAITDNWTNGAASKHTTAPISHTRPSPRSPQ